MAARVARAARARAAAARAALEAASVKEAVAEAAWGRARAAGAAWAGTGVAWVVTAWPLWQRRGKGQGGDVKAARERVVLLAMQLQCAHPRHGSNNFSRSGCQACHMSHVRIPEALSWGRYPSSRALAAAPPMVQMCANIENLTDGNLRERRKEQRQS